MSLTENFLSTAKQLLLATENLKRMEERLSRLSDDVAGINHRLVRVEALIEYSKAGAQAATTPVGDEASKDRTRRRKLNHPKEFSDRHPSG